MIICTSSALYSAHPDQVNEESNPQYVQEIVTIDPKFTVQQVSFPGEMQFPAPIFAPPHKSPFLAMGLSSLIPGLGHAYLGDMRTAGSLVGTTGVSAGLVIFSHGDESAISAGAATLQNTWLYGIYAAYRDVRIYNGESGYRYAMPTDSLGNLASAPFRPSVLKKPEVWGGLLGALGAAAGISYFFYSPDAHIHSSASKSAILPVLALPVGIGEEAFFRGYLQSQLSESLTPWGGIIVSSLAFGAVHIPNAWGLEPAEQRLYYTVSLPFITGFGVYCGWLAHKNPSLKEGVALHTWYDGILFAVSAAANQTAVTGRPGFAIDIPF